MIRWSTLDRTRLGQFFGSCRTHKVPKTFTYKFTRIRNLALFSMWSDFCFVLPRSEKKRQSIMANFDFISNPLPQLSKNILCHKKWCKARLDDLVPTINHACPQFILLYKMNDACFSSHWKCHLKSPFQMLKTERKARQSCSELWYSEKGKNTCNSRSREQQLIPKIWKRSTFPTGAALK